MVKFLIVFIVAWGMTMNVAAYECVILLHGLARTSKSMNDMEAALAAAGYRVLNLDYPSRTADIRELSESVIGDVLREKTAAEAAKVHFVTHSLGGILVRYYLSRQQFPRLGRVVMLGPPNQGSEVVDRIGHWSLFQMLNGPAGVELGTGPGATPLSLGPVKFELGVIAGDRSINWINSLMIDGADDGKVSVARTKVPGMKEHALVHTAHPFLMSNSEVIPLTLRFLRTGSFQERIH